jgi:hypothetical protein
MFIILGHISACAQAPTEDGPLQVIAGEGAMLIDYPDERPDGFTFGGFLLCIEGDTAVELTGVSALGVEGEGLVGARAVLRTFDMSDEHHVIFGALGTPPKFDEIGEVVGEFTPIETQPEVTLPCGDSDMETGPMHVAELLIILDVDGRGGGWTGMEVRYTADGRIYRSEVDWAMLACGPTVMDEGCHSDSRSALPDQLSAPHPSAAMIAAMDTV